MKTILRIWLVECPNHPLTISISTINETVLQPSNLPIKPKANKNDSGINSNQQNVKAKIPRQIKNINNIFSESDALTTLIIKYCYQF